MHDIKEILEYVLYGFLITYGTWLFYLALMNVKRAKDAGKITRVVYVLGYPLLLIGLILDFLCNVLVFSVILLELPQETLVTTRLSRHICDDTWRGKVSKWFCTNLLDQFDPSGKHCKCKHK